MWTDEGCLVSYGPDVLYLWHRAATYVDKILKGTKPADLPVEQPMKFELVINLKTAKQIGLNNSAECAGASGSGYSLNVGWTREERPMDEKTFGVVFGAVVFALWSFAWAQQPAKASEAQVHLDAAELRELIVGNTVHGQNLQGMPFKQFFHPNGTFVTEFSGTLLNGTWTITSDGTLCLANLANPANPCAVIRKSADGTFERIAAGISPARWLKVTAGNSLVSASALGEAVSFQSVHVSGGELHRF